MALEAFEKAPFLANLQLFSCGFIRVFRHPFSEPREPAQIESQEHWLSATLGREGIRRHLPPNCDRRTATTVSTPFISLLRHEGVPASLRPNRERGIPDQRSEVEDRLGDLRTKTPPTSETPAGVVRVISRFLRPT
jgi:hypothetical protein